ncbi:GNAT family N-acetyltransferase [Limosilactobacillus reuteri]|uniref:GNAT family N-acetyltransferase n=1 Tax=Limosilactobacillus reuteri TaxID=1598 RepID=A0AAW9ZL07_LIMRT|nr:GNAT family N-acetyltransferase [Limosilactobacillus reuteri]MCC4345198.1 GNAT family N-acetyltransferase [Limosilactobacillus reuteri]MCC4388779.1 GNAT family N-acetyltransferase [Limosilactobacillus reuteri]MCC4390685.1 GNAT family N-acetyltransferase [Limosilactobacillus reuteri]MCC4404547.1 GNAT family N-acetyltransferase [Limosilactobacillus reuteri]MCC4418280.1 GNAT family N-acetyltransferase [Limosilactobacillus reuteri]
MAEIYLRRAQLQDLTVIMKIIDDAKELLKKNGSPQWQNGYPDQETFTQDIVMQTNWILINDNKVVATATLQLTPEPTYRNITQGQWQQPDEPYATIHRVAISSNYRGQGLSKLLFSNLLTVGQMQGIKNFRVDTHRSNKAMQHIAENFNFKKRGIIKVNDQNDPERLAYELNLGSHHKLTRINNNFMQPLIDKL